jgi:sulfite reductase alpha subunit-like flavoprotein
MRERLDPYRGEVKVQPHEMRGSFEECRFQARILGRQSIDSDPSRSTGMVTFDLQGTGITFQPGDRLAVMPMNPAYEMAKVAAALGLDDMLDVIVPLEQGSEWGRFSRHLEMVSKSQTGGLTVKDILKRGHLAPLTKDLVYTVGLRYKLCEHC